MRSVTGDNRPQHWADTGTRTRRQHPSKPRVSSGSTEGPPLTGWPFCLAAAALALLAAAAPARAQDGAALQARGLAATCANCHGTDGRAQGTAIKPLAGMPAERLLALMAGFKSGAELSTVMQQIVRGYDDAQLRLIAGYFAALRPAAR